MKKIIAIVLSLAMMLTLTPMNTSVAHAEGVALTGVSVEGTHEIGQTLEAVPTGADGAEPTNVTYQWWISYQEWDDWDFDYYDVTQKIEGATDRYFFIPDYIYYSGNLGESASNCKIWVEVVGEDNVKKKSPAKSIARGDNVDLAKDAVAVELPKKCISAAPLTLPANGNQGSTITWSSSRPDIISNDGTVTMPQEATDVTLTGTFTKEGRSITRDYKIHVVSAADAVDPEDLASVNAAKTEVEKSLVYNAKYGTDTTAMGRIERLLTDKGINDVDVELVSVREGDESKVDDEGNILYVQKGLDDADDTITAMDKFKQAQVTLRLSKGTASEEVTTKLNIYWDIDFLKAELTRAMFDKVTEEMIKGENPSLDEVTKKIVLPQYIKYDGSDKFKLYGKFSWTVEDSSAGRIEAVGSDYPFGNKTFEFTPNQGAQAKTTNLIGKVTFNFTNNTEEEQAVASLNKEIPITIPGTEPEETIEEKLGRLLDEHIDLNNLVENGVTLYDSVDDPVGRSVPADPNHVTTDLGFNKLRKQIPDSHLYYFGIEPITDEDAKYMVPPEGRNQFMATIYRPLPGEDPVEVNFNLVLTDRETEAQAKRPYSITVYPLTKAEINKEKDLMNRAKWNFTDLIKGDNADINDVQSDLAKFMEYHWSNDEQTEAVAVDHYKLQIGTGIKPEIYQKVEGGLGDHDYVFWTSKTNIIEPDILRVNQPQYDTRVEVKTKLSSIRYARYEEKYPNNELFAGLSKQVVSANVLVKGRDGVNPNPDATIDVSLQINGSDLRVGDVMPAHRIWLPAKAVKVAADTTAMEAITKVCADEGYRLTVFGNYLAGVERPDGITLLGAVNGENAGWMFAINGGYPVNEETGLGYTLDQYSLEDGDEITLYYNNDYMKFTSIPPMGNVFEDADKGIKVTLPTPVDITKFDMVATEVEEEIGDGYAKNKGYELKFIDKYTNEEVSVETVLGKQEAFQLELTRPEDFDAEESKQKLLKKGEGFDELEAEFSEGKYLLDVDELGTFVMAEVAEEQPEPQKEKTYVHVSVNNVNAFYGKNLKAPKGLKISDLKWRSWDKSIVTVNQEARITGKKAGMTRVIGTLEKEDEIVQYHYFVRVLPGRVAKFSGTRSGNYLKLSGNLPAGRHGIKLYRAKRTSKGKYNYKYYMTLRSRKTLWSQKLRPPKGTRYGYYARAYRVMPLYKRNAKGYFEQYATKSFTGYASKRRVYFTR